MRFSGFIDLFGKVFLITFTVSLFDFSTKFLQGQCKCNSLISLILMRRYYNNYDYHTISAKVYFSVTKGLKSKKKKAGVNFVLLSPSIDMIHENLFSDTNQDSPISVTWEY